MWGSCSTHVVQQATLGVSNGTHKYRSRILMLPTTDIRDDFPNTPTQFVTLVTLQMRSETHSIKIHVGL